MPATVRGTRSAAAEPAGSTGAEVRKTEFAQVPALECCRTAARVAAGYYAVPADEVAAPTRRSRRAAQARHVAIYLAHVALGLPLRAVAAAFRRDRSTAAYACRRIEDARDDPAFDRALADLELATAILLSRPGSSA